MKRYHLNDMEKGWLIGNFPKAVYKTKTFEVAVKIEKSGEHVPYHVHKIAHEITCIVTGCVRMNGIKCTKGDIIVLEPGEISDYKVLEDTIAVVVKVPSLPDDKYMCKNFKRQKKKCR